MVKPSHDDVDRTRARLAAVERQLAADPTNEELRTRRRRLANALACKEDLALLRRRAAWGRWFLWAWEHRN